MKTYLVKMNFSTPLMTPLTADTLFGHLCWAMVRKEGSEGLRKVTFPFNEGQPPFVLSDAFPEGYLPRPFGVEMLTTDTEEAKRVRSLQWVTHEEFNELRQRRLPASIFTENGGRTGILRGIATHNSISRLSNTTSLEGGVFNLEEFYPEILDVYVKVHDDSAKNLFVELLSAVSRSGFGKKKSVGKGQFSVTGIKEFSFAALDDADGFIALSNFCPAAADPTEGLYKSFVKYGKTSEEMLPFSPFKKPLIMLKHGSVFKTFGVPKDYYGRMVKGLVPAKKDVVQYAFALAIPTKYPIEIMETA